MFRFDRLDYHLYNQAKLSQKNSTNCHLNNSTASTALEMAKRSAYSFAYRSYITLRFYFSVFWQAFSNILHNIGIYRLRCAKLPKNLQNKIVLITGANSGIGKYTAKVAARNGATVIMACRSAEKARDAIDDIVDEIGKDKREQLHFVQLDLASFASVRNCALTIAEQFDSIDVMVNNAGVMMCDKWSTADGHEYQMGANHLGHFLLTNLLLGKLRRDEKSPARIVNLSSVAHVPGEMYFDDFEMQADGAYTPLRAYTRSKLANIYFTRELSRRFAASSAGSSIRVYAVHPGLVNTELKRHLATPQQCLLDFFNRLILISPKFGAQTSLYCAFDERVADQSGFYYYNCSRVTKLLPHVVDDKAALRLWDISLKLCDIENNNFI